MSSSSSGNSGSRIIIQRVDYSDEVQGQVLIDLLDGYARDPLGGSEPLSEDVKNHLLFRLSQIPHAFSFIAYYNNNNSSSSNTHSTGSDGGGSGSGGDEDAVVSSSTQQEQEQELEPAGLINCFEGFSTFAAKPLVNIHDVYVKTEYRKQGISQALLKAVDDEARSRGCCKVTLECLSKNDVAINAYKKSGFHSYELGDPTVNGVAIFMEKKLGKWKLSKIIYRKPKQILFGPTFLC